MELLIIWLTTIIISFEIETISFLRMCKDLADNGYKFNLKKIVELKNQINPRELKYKQILKFIPIFNILNELSIMFQYNNNKSLLIDNFRIFNMIEEFTDLEKEEYLKKPTMLNALLAPVKAASRLSKAYELEIETDIESSKIFYEINEQNEIIILQISGDAKKLTLEEQKKKVNEYYKSIIKRGIEEYGDKDKFLSEIKRTNLDIRKAFKIDNNQSSLSISTQNSQIKDYTEGDLVDESGSLLTKKK